MEDSRWKAPVAKAPGPSRSEEVTVAVALQPTEGCIRKVGESRVATTEKPLMTAQYDGVCFRASLCGTAAFRETARGLKPHGYCQMQLRGAPSSAETPVLDSGTALLLNTISAAQRRRNPIGHRAPRDDRVPHRHAIPTMSGQKQAWHLR